MIDFFKIDFDKNDWQKIPVPSNWQFHTDDFPLYTNIVYPYEFNHEKSGMRMDLL